MIYLNLFFPVLLGLLRRYWGSGRKARGVVVPLLILIYTYFIFDKWLLISGFIMLMFSKGFNDWWDFGTNNRYTNWLNPLLQKIFKKEEWGTLCYDYTGMILHFSILSIPLALLCSGWVMSCGFLIPLIYMYFIHIDYNVVKAELLFGFVLGAFLLI